MHRDLIVVGASAGGIEALQGLAAGLPADLDAAVMIVQHTTGRSESLLPQVISRAGRLTAEHPADGTVWKKGRIYIAPPDRHMLVDDGVIRVLHGPRENLHRPAIDPLFRSAALTAGPRAIGVVLTGMLDDGTSGLMVVHKHGGAAIVEDPATALFSGMPQSAQEHVPEASVLPLRDIPPELVRLVAEEIAGSVPAGADRRSLEVKETNLLEEELPQIDDAERPGHPSNFACPDCGGVLWELEEAQHLRFRCRVGHAFTSQYLDAEQRHATETALWSALRALEESASLYHRLADRAQQTRQVFSAARFNARAENTEANARTLREFLARVNEQAGS